MEYGSCVSIAVGGDDVLRQQHIFLQTNAKEYQVPLIQRCELHPMPNDTFYRLKSSSKVVRKKREKKIRTSAKKLNWKMATEIGANAVRWTHLAVECIFGFVLLCVNSNERLKQFRRTQVSLFYVTCTTYFILSFSLSTSFVTLVIWALAWDVTTI